MGKLKNYMNDREANRILDIANFLLKHFPHGFNRPKKRSRRKPYLRAKHIGNRKVFFNILKEKYDGLNKRDKARRYKVIPHLADILKSEVPSMRLNDREYVYIIKIADKKFTIVLKEIKRGNVRELYLYSIYPLHI
jgi:hypothetical protein